MPCDICGDQKATKSTTAQAMSRAVLLGFNPFANGLIPANLARLATPASQAEWRHHAIHGLLSHGDWKLCDICIAELKT
jgi:hypothetical protein